MARLIATPIRKSGARANSLTGSRTSIRTPKVEVGPALDKNSPFITVETKLNFESMMHDSLSVQEVGSSVEDTKNQGDPMDICDERPESTETSAVSLNSENIANITASVYEEMERRVDQLRALLSPERKKILEIDDVKTEVPITTPFKNNNETSLVEQTPSSNNRFARLHEEVFSKMPSISTHYAAQKTKKIEENQNENKKRKIPDNVHSPLKKQKLAQDGQATKVVKPIVKKTYDRNRTIINNRSSTRLNSTKGKSVSQTEVQSSAESPRTSSRLDAQKSLKKPLSYIPHKGPFKFTTPNPEEQRMKEREELERRKQAAKNGMLCLH